MEDKKRMAGSYEIIQAFHIGDREIVLGEDINAKPEERYMCAYCQQSEIAALYKKYDKYNFLMAGSIAAPMSPPFLPTTPIIFCPLWRYGTARGISCEKQICSLSAPFGKE